MASAAEHPLLDVDGTVFIQFGIFMAVFFVASHFLFKPYLKMREEREKGIEGAKVEAEQMSAKADAELADYEAKLAAARSKANEERRNIRSEAVEYQRKITEETKVSTMELLEKSQQQVSSETEKAKAELLPSAETLANQIVQKMIGREL